MTPLKIRISRLSDATQDVPLPGYATEGSAGMDIHAAVAEPMTIPSGMTVLVPTGFSMEIPTGFEAQVRPRSGLAVKHSIGIMNAPGTIDSDFRGEVKVILTNFGTEPFTVRRGDRIAQMVVARYERVQWEEAGELTSTQRGAGGFGHTGTTTH
ncbi:MAG: dUTP diphosphatase [Bacteroidetes bacterium]|nr:dUTP diphosphatase [Bacteroidota bacterium]